MKIPKNFHSSFILFFILLLLSFLSLARAADFGYPVNGEPWYFIKVSFSENLPQADYPWEIAQVSVNGQKVRDFILFQRNEELLNQEIKVKLPFEVKIRYPWQANQIYNVEVLLKNQKTKNQVSLRQPVTAPPLRGYWNPDWKNYLSLIVAEEDGIKRENYPIQTTLSVLSTYLASPNEVRVVKAEKNGQDISYREIPSQVYDVISWDDKKLLSNVEIDEASGERIIRYHPTTTFSLTFLANLNPNEKATYLVFYNNPKAEKPNYSSDLKVSGQGLGKIIENKYYKVTLNRKSGVIYEITEKNTGLRLEHKLETNGSIHWNPDVYSPPHSWYHTSDWENPPYHQIEGPIFYSVQLADSLPFNPNIKASVTYYFYAGTPFILVETTVNFIDSMFVQALRNGEVVFNKKIFNQAAYRTMSGEVKVIDLSRTKIHPKHVIDLRPDVPWVIFFNHDKHIAFANLYLKNVSFNLEGGPASLEQPFVYIQNGPWYYLARGLVYSFGTNNQTRMLPVRKGSVYYEKNIFYPYSFQKGQDFSAEAEKVFQMMKHPLAVFESLETYAETPEKWVAPILTEPFEEGVKGAIGGKKKK